MTTGEDSRPASLSELQMVRDQLNGRIDDLREQLNGRIEDLQRMMLWGMGLLGALMIALIGAVLSGA